MSSHASGEAMVASQSLTRRRQRLSQAKVRSTTHLLGSPTKPRRAVELLDDVDGEALDVHHCGPQPGRQQMPAAEDVKRQVAEAVVIAVEEPPFLVAVQRIVGGVEIKRDLRRRLAMGLEEQINEPRLDGGRIVTDPVIPRGVRTARFQPVQR